MHRTIRSLCLLLLMPACSQAVRSSPPVPLAPEVYQKINQEAQLGRTVVELQDTVLRSPSLVRLTSNSVTWLGGGGESSASIDELQCIRLSWTRGPTIVEGLGWGAAFTLGAGVAMTAFFAIIEEGGGAPGMVGGMMINTVIASPLAFPLGMLLARPVTNSRTYTFPSITDESSCHPPPAPLP